MDKELSNDSFMSQEQIEKLFSKIFPGEVGHNFENWFKLGKVS